MADQAITALPKKTYSGSSQIASTDYLLGIDSAEGYQMLIQDLGEYIINRATASLAGSTQTLASAISALNSNLPYVGTGTIASAIASKVTAGVNHGFFLAKNDLADTPSGAYYKIEYIRVAGTNNVYTKAYANHAADNTYEALFDYTTVTSLSGLWTKLPTRAEVDALNSNFAGSISKAVNSWTDAIEAAKNANYRIVSVRINGTDSQNLPTGFNVHWGTIYCNPGGTYGAAILQSFSGDIYTKGLSAGTWSDWQKMPTRAEMDAATVKTLTVTATADANGYIDTGLKYNQAVPLCVYSVTIDGSAAYPFLYEFLMRGGSPAEKIAVRIKRWNGEIYTGEITFSMKYI